MRHNNGFTLIELSIVLVIIGLIVGGVLVGRDMIEAAAVRAQVAQFEQYDAAVNTFRTKYNGLPGDLRYDQAAALGFATRVGGRGDGDGDGSLEGYGGCFASFYFSGETALFWNDLATATLIPGSYTLDVDSMISVSAGTQNLYLPVAKIGGGNSITVFSIPAGGVGANNFPNTCMGQTFCYSVVANLSASSPSAGDYQGQAGITPLQAFAIDNKMDDGIPNSGRVQGSVFTIYMGSAIINTGSGTTVTGTCLTSSSGVYSYNIGDKINASQPVCIINVAHQ